MSAIALRRAVRALGDGGAPFGRADTGLAHGLMDRRNTGVAASEVMGEVAAVSCAIGMRWKCGSGPIWTMRVSSPGRLNQGFHPRHRAVDHQARRQPPPAPPSDRGR